MRKILIFLIIMVPNIADARCLGMWEVSTLARGPHPAYNLNTKDGHTLITISNSMVQKISSISAKIDRASGVYKKLFICGNRTPNAFATNSSGVNVVAITTGLIERAGNDWDLYAALIGHENAHLVHGHGSQRQARQLAIGILQILAQAAVASMTGQDSLARTFGEEVVGLGGEAVYANYSREDEAEADRSGLKFAHQSGFDPFGAIRLHQLLASSSDFFSSHPSSSDRIASLTAQIASMQTSGRQVASVSQPSGVSSGIEKGQSYSRNDAISQSSRSQGSASAFRQQSDKGRSGSGVIVKVKSRYSYFIATQSDFGVPVQGMTAKINFGERMISGTVERVIGGYFSVLTTASIDNAMVGAKVNFQ
jgi:Zn-dependent protease with chaperone function